MRLVLLPPNCTGLSLKSIIFWTHWNRKTGKETRLRHVVTHSLFLQPPEKRRDCYFQWSPSLSLVDRNFLILTVFVFRVKIIICIIIKRAYISANYRFLYHVPFKVWLFQGRTFSLLRHWWEGLKTQKIMLGRMDECVHEFWRFVTGGCKSEAFLLS